MIQLGVRVRGIAIENVWRARTARTARYKHRRFQTRASPGIARVKLWSIVLIAYHYIVLQDVVQSPLTKARRLGGGTGFFSAHKPTASAARVACPGSDFFFWAQFSHKLARLYEYSYLGSVLFMNIHIAHDTKVFVTLRGKKKKQ